MHRCDLPRPKQSGRPLVVLHIHPSRGHARSGWVLGRARSSMPSRRLGRPFSYDRAPHFYSAFGWPPAQEKGAPATPLVPTGGRHRSLALALPLRRHAAIVLPRYRYTISPRRLTLRPPAAPSARPDAALMRRRLGIEAGEELLEGRVGDVSGWEAFRPRCRGGMLTLFARSSNAPSITAHAAAQCPRRRARTRPTSIGAPRVRGAPYRSVGLATLTRTRTSAWVWRAVVFTGCRARAPGSERALVA